MLLDLPEELLHSIFEALSPAARDTLRYTCHTLAKLGRSHKGVAHEAATAKRCVLDELRRYVDGPVDDMSVDITTPITRAITYLHWQLLHESLSTPLTPLQFDIIRPDFLVATRSSCLLARYIFDRHD